MFKNYNPGDKESIYEYAKELKGKTFKDVCNEDKYFLTEIVKEVTEEEYKVSYENKSRKGGLGEIIEERYFHYKADNISKADFPEAEVELKVTPYRINRNGSVSAKERLIISMINYMNIIDMDFYNSNAWEKLKNILLVYYLWEPDIEDRLDYLINFVYMLTPEGEDLKIIENDFYKIRQKVIDGKAHELSEGDTLYLGAATKSSSSRDRTSQPNSEILAKPRAFSLKTSYMTYVLKNYIIGDKERKDKILKGDKISEFEKYVLDKINQYSGEKDKNLFENFFDTKNLNSKNKYSRLAFEILGVKTKNAEEFEKANIEVKAIRIEENKTIRESMSFPNFKIMELIKQSWDESDIYNYFSATKFLFVIYRKEEDSYYLEGSKFWNMPISDIEGKLKEEWEKSVDIFKTGVKFSIQGINSPIRNNLPKKSNTEILHVRPHAQKGAHLINGIKYGNGDIERDTDLLPDGNRMTKQCFWLNNDYILKQIEDKSK
jgi:DNA mismatch repair protein MutH